MAELERQAPVQQMGNYMQHGSVSTLEHCKRVTRLSFAIRDWIRLRVNEDTLLMGAMLHDFYLYDWHMEDDGSHHLHGLIHADRARRNAEKYFSVDEKVQQVILTHMWPLNLTRIPRSSEAWIVCAADKLASIQETLFLR